MIRLLTADRLAPLVAQLAHDHAAAPLPPLDDETIVVQSQGMRRWLQLELARRHGCAASLRMPFPASFCRALADRMHPPAPAGRFDDPADDPFDREVITWRIVGMLEAGAASEDVFRPLRRFCAAGPRQRLGLAGRVARVFDDYVLYRPELIDAWERGALTGAGPHEEWQAELWRRVRPEAGAMHAGRRLTALVDELEGAAAPPPGLPSRLAVFGVSSLPPLFVRLLAAVARFAPVTFYLALDGSRTAHPLAEAWGSQARDLADLLEDAGARRERVPTGEERRAAGAGAATPSGEPLLARLQRDIAAGNRGGRGEAHRLEDTDASLRVHVCHSPLREMEVLRDQLLAAFDADRDLRPHDVLVMVPDVAAYQPYVEAVFGATADGAHLPFHVADRALSREFSLARHVLDLLALVDGRRAAQEVLALLDAPAVRRRAGIAEASLPSLHSWTDATRIRWGTDGRERADAFGLPAVEANTWRAGLDRLVMGYAAGPVEALVAGVLPAAGDTAGAAALLGSFTEWADELFGTLDALRAPRPLAAWRTALLELLDRTVLAHGDEEERALTLVRGQLDTLARMQFRAGYEAPVELAVVRDWLSHVLRDDSLGSGFLAGGVTFAALKPMRAIPFKVVAMAGLDDASFPRRDRPPAFDLIAAHPRPGDRSLRTDDRQLFLDTLLAAERQVILSYVGRSAVDNSVRAPSVVVAELLDHLERCCTADRGVRETIVVEHRLQPFSRDYYTAEGPLFSYSAEHAAACAVSVREGGEVPAFVADQRGEPGVPGTGAAGSAAAQPIALTLADLIDCWINPSRFWCRRVLRLQIDGGDAGAEEHEPVSVDGLVRYQLESEMIHRRLGAAHDAAAELVLLDARGDLPPGALVAPHHRRLDASARRFAARVGRPAYREPVPLHVTGDGWTLVGRVDGVTTEGLLQFRPAALKPRDRVRAWLAHLALAAEHGTAGEARLVGNEREVRWREPEQPKALLDGLVAGYREALRTPLPVFEYASHEYARPPGGRKRDPLTAARDAFVVCKANGRETGDLLEAHVALCWRGRDPFATHEEEFRRWSGVLWEPLYRHVVEGE